VYPPLSCIRTVSIKIAATVATEAWRTGLARRPLPNDIEADIRSRMFELAYRDYAASH
jgi:malate dehydrogenase (oxaloacetate-decarboxylating)(NADP+)